MDGAFHGVHLMESRPEGPILHDENNATQTTFTYQELFKANSKGGDVLFASFFAKGRLETCVVGNENAVTRQQEPAAPGVVAAAAAAAAGVALWCGAEQEEHVDLTGTSATTSEGLEGQFGLRGNAIHRLQLVGFNFYRARAALEGITPVEVLRKALFRYTGLEESTRFRRRQHCNGRWPPPPAESHVT
jgi:hypothetical protein